MNVVHGPGPQWMTWSASGPNVEANGTVDANDPGEAAQRIFAVLSDGTVYDDVTVPSEEVADALEELLPE